MSIELLNKNVETTSPTYFIRTFGCQMNVADSLEYSRVLEGLGCVRSEDEMSADIVIINTCTIREKADEKAISYIGNIVKKRHSLAEASGYPLRGGVALVGCMASIRGDEVSKRFSDVKLVIPSSEMEHFESRIMETWPELVGSDAAIQTEPVLRPEEKYGRFINIVRGCANRCTYCIVPTSRGGELISRPREIIFREIQNVLNAGVRSITFLGQNVSAYGQENTDGYGLPELLSDVRDEFAADGIWFKFLTSHPSDVSDELIDVLNTHDSFSHWIHLPVQAGDNEILQRMDRGYTREYYMDLVGRIRDKLPYTRLSTDLIVGFPGEDEPAFMNTLDLVENVEFDAAFTFLYSTRRNTPASKWADPVPREEKKRRFDILVETQNRIAMDRAQSHVGRELTVLVEGEANSSGRNGSLMMASRSREEQMVVLPGVESDFGQMVRCRITEAKLRSFRAERID
jgi:tRNA-2-methylthio-N6-dimethylallyladenosine synthase